MSLAAQRRQRVLDTIANAAGLARRDPADVQLIAVSKGRPPEEIEPLIEEYAALFKVMQAPPATFGQIKDANGNYLLNSTLRTAPFQAQLGLRIQF